MILTSVLFATLYMPSQVDAQAIAKHMQLTIGESQVLNLSEQDVTLSRKGVVDLFHQGNGSWLLTGLKRGFVLIKSGNHLWKVTIIDHAGPSDNRDTICDDQSARCQSNSIQIVGLIDRPERFYKLMSRCQQTLGCVFSAKLSTQGKTNVAHLLRNYSWTFTENGRVEIKTYCPDNQAPNLELPKGMLVDIRCRVDVYQIETKVIADVKQKSSLVGAEFTSRSGLSWVHKPLDIRKFNDGSSDHTSNLEAFPKVEAIAGQSVVMHAGGEFLIPSNSESSQQTWKKHGLEIEFKIEPLEKEVKIFYKIQMSDRTSNTGIVGSELQSTTVLPLNQETLVAEIPFRGEHYDKQESMLLSKIPIIGPIFSTVGKQSSDRTLSIIFQVMRKNLNTDP